MKRSSPHIALISIFILISSTCIFSQTQELNHQKYRVYRERLIKQFMYVNNKDPYADGSSIPASRRNYASKEIEFGDATIYLANWLQVLATEYALRKRDKLPVESTLKDLHLAIEAFVRLDINAEYHFRENGIKPMDEDFNGFFIRDDVDSNYVQKYRKHFGDMDAGWTVKSDFIYRQQYEVNPEIGRQYAVEMSKDQCWHLYLGFALISKLLDGVEMNINGINYNFAERIRTITKNIQFQLGGTDEKKHRWKIYNPADGHQIPENRGGKVRLYSYGFGIAGSAIVGENLHAKKSSSWFWRRMFLMSWRWKDWQADDFGARALSTIGNVRKYNDLKRLYKESKRKKVFSYPHFTLMHLILYPDEYSAEEKNKVLTSLIMDDLKLHLNEAPMEGPTGDATHYWSSDNCVVWPERRGKGSQGEKYNGLDYMLLHNLYYLSKN